MRRAIRSGRSLIAALVTGAALAVALPAGASSIPGATYNGIVQGGATLTFHVSSDGTIVDSYGVSGLHGTTPDGGSCSYTAGGAAGQWDGAPIQQDSFSYQAGDGILFSGHFTGAQGASGTLRFNIAPANSNQACDTGTVSWTATTNAQPPAGGSPGAGTGSGSGSSSQGSGRPGSSTNGRHAHPVSARIVLHRLHGDTFGGTVSSTQVCRALRRVVLWEGARRAASTRTRHDGSYSFILGRWARAYRFRAAVTTARGTGRTECAAASSAYVRG